MRTTGEQPVDIAALTRAYIALGQADEAEKIYTERAARHPELPRDTAAAIARFVPGHERTAVFRDLTENATALAVTPDGRRVLAATGGATVRTWTVGATHAEPAHVADCASAAWPRDRMVTPCSSAATARRRSCATSPPRA